MYNLHIPQVGSIGGNLMLKHQHPEFPSDIFLTLLGTGASLTLGTAADASTSEVTLEQFLSISMAGRVILSVTLPQLSLNTQIHSYKIGPRAVNAHAYVNAVFRFEVNTTADFQITSKPFILYGGINPNFVSVTLLVLR
ncbi:putative aldehyde oxidase-like protein [Portunus trituberculatus]|uniref:Putative aldehyde oxidase-like protein n=1 Tax=Portunus trituberculatus TaxID=210409 RepID=A0A5B7GYR4_PORTR|nr:putative aldehyde oxidase-like protein [Portunus trituberculatus]